MDQNPLATPRMALEAREIFPCACVCYVFYKVG